MITNNYIMEVFGGICYRHFVLCVLLITHLLNQLDRYMLAVTIRPMARELQFGDQSCQVNSTFLQEDESASCSFKNITSCQEFTTDWNATNICIWDYDGEGLPYQIVAGPVFTVVFTITGIIIGFAGDGLNRKNILCCCLIFWSSATILTGFVNAYWQLVLLRLALGIGEAGCTPFATSLIADYFPKARRGLALGVYNLGIYMGYSLSFALGNFVTESNILGQGWRWSFIVSGCPGFLLSGIMAFAVKEPKEDKTATNTNDKGKTPYKKLDSSKEENKTVSGIVDLKENKKYQNTTSGQTASYQPEAESSTLDFSNRGCQSSTTSIKSSMQEKDISENVRVQSHAVNCSAKWKKEFSPNDSEAVISTNIQSSYDGNKAVVYSENDHIICDKSPGWNNRLIGCVRETKTKFVVLFKPFVNPSLSLLVVSGSLRNSAGYVWAYNTQPFFSSIGESPREIGAYMSWIPMVGGSIGVVLGGFISDNFVKKRGAEARVLVVVVSQMLAVPFAVATLMVSPPAAYFFQIPSYIIGEMWVGVTLTVVIELVPCSSRTAAVALYLFISTNFGGIVPLIVPSLQKAFLDAGFTKSESFRRALCVLYPGMVLIGAAFFLLTLFVMRKHRARNRSQSNVEIDVAPQQS